MGWPVSSRLSAPVDYRAKAMKGLSQLPPFSPILNKLLATLSADDVSFAQLADLIEKDTVLAGNVLRMVNSALCGMRGTINSVRHAVSIMGMNKLRNTAMSLSVSRIWRSIDLPADWSPAMFNLHAIAVAILADLIVQRMEVEYPEGAFAGGLLHDLGMLLVAIALKEEFTAIRRECQSSGRSLADCERERLETDHAELSADALAEWNLPAPIQAAVRLHHAPVRTDNGSFTLAHVLNAADSIAILQGVPVQRWTPPCAATEEEILQQLGLVGLSSNILEDYNREFEAIRNFF